MENFSLMGVRPMRYVMPYVCKLQQLHICVPVTKASKGYQS